MSKLRALGLEVVIERGAGAAAGYGDEDYERADAVMADRDEVFACEIVAKVRPPTDREIALFREGAVLVSLIYPARNEGLVEVLNERKITVIALDKVPRTTRAQSMDVLSSMANLAGYRAVVEAAAEYQGFFGPQVTAAGTLPPARILVIGAGVAGLAAIAAGRALGAEVRAFDTRAAAREQVESLGGTFLEVDLQESGEGQGGYAKVMSPEFIEAEMKLFEAQAREVSVIVTTALVPGAKAPVLVPKRVVDQLAPGSIVVDLAAEQGGNCELTQPDQTVVHRGVKILGPTDLVSRMASSASRFFSANAANLMALLVKDQALSIDLEDEIVRGACLAHAGEVLPPAPPPEPSPAKPKAKAGSRPPPPPDAKAKQQDIMTPTRRAWGANIGGMLVVLALFVLGRFAPGEFLQHFTVFILACFVGWQVIWSVTPALHTPLMSVTNAISGIIVVGGMVQTRNGQVDAAAILGAVSILVAAINISGGFLVTQRMLGMFRRDEPPR